MVEFIAENGEIELKSYDPGTTLTELSNALDEFRLKHRLKTSKCKGCGKCCSDNIPVLGPDLRRLPDNLGISFEQAVGNIVELPEKPDIAARRKAIAEISDTMDIPKQEAALIYEYNNAEPIILAKQKHGECIFLANRLCSIYSARPYSCGLYLCNMGERLSYMQEMIVRQGTWHAYFLLGWINKADIAHNPFLKADSYDKLLLADFDFNLENSLHQLFFYY